MKRTVAFVLVLVAMAVGAAAAEATVTISRAELNGTKLRIEGRAIADRTITVDGVPMGTSDAAGNFRVERDPFAKPDDCTVDVNDGSATSTPARLDGCTTSTPPPPSPPPDEGTTGTIQIVRGGTGFGRITSSPAGIDCTIAPSGITGPCVARYPVGTRVRLEARAAVGSEFRGWALTSSCRKAPDVTVQNALHSCQPVFQPK